MSTIKSLIIGDGILPDDRDTLASSLTKTFPEDVEIALSAGLDPRTDSREETRRAKRVSEIFGLGVGDYRYSDGVVCATFDKRVLQVVLYECPMAA